MSECLPRSGEWVHTSRVTPYIDGTGNPSPLEMLRECGPWRYHIQSCAGVTHAARVKDAHQRDVRGDKIFKKIASLFSGFVKSVAQRRYDKSRVPTHAKLSSQKSITDAKYMCSFPFFLHLTRARTEDDSNGMR